MQGSTDTLPILWVEHGHALEVHLSFAEANGLSNPIMTGALSPDGNRIECKFRTMGQKDQADALNRKSQ